MNKIIDGDERMPSEIAEDLGLVGQVVVSDTVKTTTAQIIAQHADLLDQCIREDDERPLMTIVSAVMASLNPQNQWKGD